jgi:hypothetical protein
MSPTQISTLNMSEHIQAIHGIIRPPQASLPIAEAEQKMRMLLSRQDVIREINCICFTKTLGYNGKDATENVEKYLRKIVKKFDPSISEETLALIKFPVKFESRDFVRTKFLDGQFMKVDFRFCASWFGYVFRHNNQTDPIKC